MELEKEFLGIVRNNRNLRLILERAGELGAPNWYVGGGAVAQTVWNHAHGFLPEYGIKDYDLVYFDAGDTSYEAEDLFIQKSQKIFQGISAPLDIKNQARVHLWHKNHFGVSIKPYQSAEEAIATWPATATSIGVRKNQDGQFKIRAPFGLNDLFAMIVRANKIHATTRIYNEKIERWAGIWPKLKIIPYGTEDDRQAAV